MSQWYRIHLPMQETCLIPSGGRSHMPWSNNARVPQLLKRVCPRACAPKQEKPRQWEACIPQLESSLCCCWCCWCCCCCVASVLSDSVRPHRRQPTRLPRPWDSPGKNTGVGYHCLLQCVKVKRESEVAQSCPTLSDPMDCSLPGSSIHGIFQARVLEWGAIAFSDTHV